MKNKIILIGLIFLSITAQSQIIDSTLMYVNDVSLDTLHIFESEMKMPRKNYYRHFNVIEGNSSYVYNPYKFSHQDSIFYFTEKKNIYIEYYKKKTKRIEGRIEGNFVGEIKYYDKHGKLIREEYWNNILYFVRDSSGNTIDDAINWDDRIFQCGVWKYYKKTKLIKSINYQMQIKSDYYIWSKSIINHKTGKTNIEEITIPIDSDFMDKLSFN